ncbi:MAG: PhzF family phenazine biosynthesis protein [Chloroflexota bacterium]|nr:PhzF family phenazine biosynthesis protein [Chloroflexota bacterium]
MKSVEYHLVDVFTDRAFGGNPLAVFIDARGLSAALMQSLAKEMNLSECTFVLPAEDPRNHYRVRIFTPDTELPMAGHPIVGTSFVLAREQMIEYSGDGVEITLEEGIGPVPVGITFQAGLPAMIEMTQQLPSFARPLTDRAAVAAMLSLEVESLVPNLPVQVVSCGVPILLVPLRDLEAARAIKVRQDLLEQMLSTLGTHEVFVFTQEVERSSSTIHSRMFAPGLGIAEDPATGAASGPVGCYLVHHGIIGAGPTTHIISEQGIEMGRPSSIHVTIERDGGEITRVGVGGQRVYMGKGTIELDIV